MLECLMSLLAISSRVEVINVPDGAPGPTVVLLVEPLGSATAADLEIASKDCRIEVQSYLDFDRDSSYTYNIRKYTEDGPGPMTP